MPGLGPGLELETLTLPADVLGITSHKHFNIVHPTAFMCTMCTAGFFIKFVLPITFGCVQLYFR